MDPILGQLILFSGNYQINGWAFCNGQLMSIAQNSALFSILGTTYGGDGIQTFALPNLQGRVPIGFGTANYGTTYELGEMAGAPSVTLNAGNVPPHIHPASVTAHVQVSGNPADSDDPANSLLTVQSNSFYASAGSPGSNLGGVAATAAVGPNTGGGQPVQIMPPYLAMNYLIALEGIYPSRA
ncbi:MAG: phage tail protein [Chitinophagales bacterium]|nr:phage tail protein [Chitinophagales bacterium]